MTRRERRLFWLALLAAGLAALYLLSEVLLPFVAGMAIAYFLDPLVDRLERIGCGRALGTTAVLLAFLVVSVGFVLLLVPALNAQLLRLIEALPAVLARIEPLVRPALEAIGTSAGGGALESLPSMAGGALKWLANLAGRVVSGGVAFANLLSLALITPIVAFYLLRDWDRIVATIDGWLPRAQRDTIREQARAVDASLAAFVRGQGSVCLALAAYYAVALSAAGLDFGLAIGLFAGMVSFVPFVGAVLGGLLSVGLAAAQFAAWPPVAVVAAIFVVGQIAEGYVLTPKLVGDAVGLHPVWVIFALLAGGALFGFVGVLLALPAAAAIGVLGRFALSRYLASPLHLHGIPPPDDRPPGPEEDGDGEGER